MKSETKKNISAFAFTFTILFVGILFGYWFRGMYIPTPSKSEYIKYLKMFSAQERAVIDTLNSGGEYIPNPVAQLSEVFTNKYSESSKAWIGDVRYVVTNYLDASSFSNVMNGLNSVSFHQPDSPREDEIKLIQEAVERALKNGTIKTESQPFIHQGPVTTNYMQEWPTMRIISNWSDGKIVITNNVHEWGGPEYRK